VRSSLAERGKTAHEKIGKYLAAVRPEHACPELVEGSKGRQKRGIVTQNDATV